MANAAFRKGQCSFLGMADIISKTMSRVSFDANPDLDVYLSTDCEARKVAASYL